MISNNFKTIATEQSLSITTKDNPEKEIKDIWSSLSKKHGVGSRMFSLDNGSNNHLIFNAASELADICKIKKLKN